MCVFVCDISRYLHVPLNCCGNTHTHIHSHSMLRWNQPEITGLSGFCDKNNLIGLRATRWVVLSPLIGHRTQCWTQLCVPKAEEEVLESIPAAHSVLCNHLSGRHTDTHTHTRTVELLLSLLSVYCIFCSPLLLIWIIFSLFLMLSFLLTQTGKENVIYSINKEDLM